MQSKHAWTKVTKKNQWKYVKPIVKKAMKSGKMEAIGKTKGKEIVYKFVYNYKGKIIEGTCIAKKGASCIIKMWMLKIENTSEYNKTTDWQVSKNLIIQRGIYNEV